jgi:hypothetical protein
MFRYFSKLRRENRRPIKSRQARRVLYVKTLYIYNNTSLNSSMSEKFFRQNCRQNQHAHFLFSNFFFWKSCRLWDNVEKCGQASHTTDDNIIRRMRFASWITNATNTRSEYVILIAFPRQPWLRERASLLRYTYISYLVSFPAYLYWLAAGHYSFYTIPLGNLAGRADKLLEHRS